MIRLSTNSAKNCFHSHAAAFLTIIHLLGNELSFADFYDAKISGKMIALQCNLPRYVLR